MYDELYHYGTPRHSGRYPWGSGENPYQHEDDFLNYIDRLKANGLTEKERAEACGLSIAQLRAQISRAKDERYSANQSEAFKLYEEGMSKSEIARKLGVSEGTVRNYISNVNNNRAQLTNTVADILKENVDNKKYIDVGVGTEGYLGVSRTKLKTAIDKLEKEGYTVHYVQVQQLGTAPGNKTTVMVLAGPGVKTKDIYKNMEQISLVDTIQDSDGNYISANKSSRSSLGLEKPVSVNSDRIMVRYAEDGGSDKDGVIELRRGVDDISLGRANYAQVRIAVDDTHYLKGMAMYSDDMPSGVDIIFNSHESKNVPKKDCFKKLSDDPDNPFGSTIKREENLRFCQRYYTDKQGNKQLSAINVVNEEGDWDAWSKNLASQMVSKQPLKFAKDQLNLAYLEKKSEYDEYMALTNPAVKKRLLESFADDCDAAAVHLKAAALPRQRTQVILPITDLKETEIYAPNFRNGEKVVLIRYPHGGKFEIPELTVNNNHPTAEKILGNTVLDAVGISPKVAARLSGADFDGDTAIVIPNNKKKIQSEPALAGLKDFDPKEAYAYVYKEGEDKSPGKTISEKRKNQEMGNVSNLITDMTIKGATQEEICRAVKHSMVVIDAYKHNLNYKQSYIDNGIAELKERYQGGKNKGAATIISRAKSPERVPKRKQYVKIDPNTGEKIYTETGETYIDEKGKEHIRTITTTKMANAKDAYELSSGQPIEAVYADHANKLKALANQARKETLSIKPLEYSPSARKVYSKEVAELNSALNVAIKNKPLERKAQIIANTVVSSKLKDNPYMDDDDIKKVKNQALAEARSRVGAKKTPIVITDKQWDAIQAGAITNNTLKKIVDNSDLDRLKQMATPREQKAMNSSKLLRAKAMLNAGWTYAEIADALGVSVSTISKNINR